MEKTRRGGLAQCLQQRQCGSTLLFYTPHPKVVDDPFGVVFAGESRHNTYKWYLPTYMSCHLRYNRHNDMCPHTRNNLKRSFYFYFLVSSSQRTIEHGHGITHSAENKAIHMHHYHHLTPFSTLYVCFQTFIALRKHKLTKITHYRVEEKQVVRLDEQTLALFITWLVDGINHCRAIKTGT